MTGAFSPVVAVVAVVVVVVAVVAVVAGGSDAPSEQVMAPTSPFTPSLSSLNSMALINLIVSSPLPLLLPPPQCCLESRLNHFQLPGDLPEHTRRYNSILRVEQTSSVSNFWQR